MHKIKIVVIAAALTLATTGAFAGSAISALNSGNVVSFSTVTPAQEIEVRAGIGRFEQVDVQSLRSRIAQDPRLMLRLQSYGSSLDDVVGISGSDSSDVTILVRG